MATLEQKLADQLADALSDRRFKAGFFPARVGEMPFETQEQIAQIIVYLLNYWSINYEYNQFQNTPQNIGAFATVLIRAYEEWKEIGGGLE